MSEDFYRFVPESLAGVGERFAIRFQMLAVKWTFGLVTTSFFKLRALDPAKTLTVELLLSARFLVDPRTHRLSVELIDLFSPISAALNETDGIDAGRIC